MTTMTKSSLAIPAGWLNAAIYLSDYGRNATISNEDWQSLGDWLKTTPFDNGNFIAGEAGLALIRDYAPADLRRTLVDSLTQSDLLPRLKALLPEVLQGPRVEQVGSAVRTN
jgi:hypothetical protein